MSDTYIFRTTASETAAGHLEHVQARGCNHEAVKVEGDLYALIECDWCAQTCTLAEVA